MSSDRGSITIWLLGLVLLLFGLGAVVLDLWSVLSARVELDALVDSAAIAAASALDEEALRAGEGIVLVPVGARARAAGVLAADPPDAFAVSVVGDEVTVTARTSADLRLLPLLLPAESTVTVRAEATAVPELRP